MGPRGFGRLCADVCTIRGPGPERRAVTAQRSSHDVAFAVGELRRTSTGDAHGERMTRSSSLDRKAFPVMVVSGSELLRLARESMERITAELRSLGHEIVVVTSANDALALVTSAPSFASVVLDWSLDCEGEVRPAEALLKAARSRHAQPPVFLLVERRDLEDIPLDVAEIVQ